MDKNTHMKIYAPGDLERTRPDASGLRFSAGTDDGFLVESQMTRFCDGGFVALDRIGTVSFRASKMNDGAASIYRRLARGGGHVHGIIPQSQ